MVNDYRNALRGLWDGRCSVYVQKPVVNEANGRSEPTETVVLQNEPCRISYRSIPGTSPVDGAAEVKQVVKLILSETVTIPPGSKIVVTQKGITTAYKGSGRPAVYSAHQEITLDLFKEWA